MEAEGTAVPAEGERKRAIMLLNIGHCKIKTTETPQSACRVFTSFTKGRLGNMIQLQTPYFTYAHSKGDLYCSFIDIHYRRERGAETDR